MSKWQRLKTSVGHFDTGLWFEQHGLSLLVVTTRGGVYNGDEVSWVLWCGQRLTSWIDEAGPKGESMGVHISQSLSCFSVDGEVVAINSLSPSYSLPPLPLSSLFALP